MPAKKKVTTKKKVVKKAPVNKPVVKELSAKTKDILSTIDSMQKENKTVTIICEYGKASRQRHLTGDETTAQLTNYIEANHVVSVRGVRAGSPSFKRFE